jgi:predicted cobalt transporter CbtA
MYAAVAASGFLWIVIGLIGIIVFQRVGRTPNVLAATNEELTWTHRRFWWMRTRAFAGDQVAAITVKKVHDIFRRNRAFRLRIHFKANRPFTLGINSPDASLADRAASALRKILKLAAESEN